MVECYELDMYADVRKDSWVSVEVKEKIESHLADLQPEESVNIVLDYMCLQLGQRHDQLRLSDASR